MSLTALVFGVVAAVFIILAVIFWQGVALPGVRVVATVTILIALIGSFAPLLAGSAGGNVVAEEAIRIHRHLAAADALHADLDERALMNALIS